MTRAQLAHGVKRFARANYTRLCYDGQAINRKQGDNVTPTPFEQAALNIATLGGNMAATCIISTHIQQLIQEEEAFSAQCGGAPNYYEMASIGMLWAQLAELTSVEA